jgi:hypothetical protein
MSYANWGDRNLKDVAYTHTLPWPGLVWMDKSLRGMPWTVIINEFIKI